MARAYATSCADTGTTAELEVQSITIDGEASPLTGAPSAVSFSQGYRVTLDWTNADASPGLLGLTEEP